MATNSFQKKKVDALKAIQELNGDTSVGNLETQDALMELRGEINMMLDAIESDIERDCKAE